ncbi:MAG: DUF523 domain-containing protein [Candidatus Marinimicrobia bacterium]|nr:DUF523 domain-containing protein [Candidatus Neomarinimicrobiota bacterium]
MKQSIIISACLLGRECRYNGGHSKISKLESLDVDFIPVCPEEAGKLGTPRPPAELITSTKDIIEGSGKIITENGDDVTQQFLDGSKKELSKLKSSNAQIAVLKSRSPSCGYGQVYDGTFTGKLCKGNGIFSQMCEDEGVTVISSDRIDSFIKDIKPKE